MARGWPMNTYQFAFKCHDCKAHCSATTYLRWTHVGVFALDRVLAWCRCGAQNSVAVPVRIREQMKAEYEAELSRRRWGIAKAILYPLAIVAVLAMMAFLTGCATRPVHVTQTQPGDTTQRPITQPESPWDFPRDPDAPHEPPVVVDRPQWRADALRTQQSAISALLHDRVPVPADLVAVRDTLDYGLGYLDAGATWGYVATMQRRGIAGLQTSGVASSYADEFREVLRALTMAAVREG